MEALSMSNVEVAPALARGRYRLLEEIGVGGMATVYRGHDERLGRHVAVKVMKPDLAANSKLRARFLQEARTLARLAHPHVVQIYDSGEDEDHRLYIAMELLGRSLQHLLDRHGRLPPRLASELMVQVLDGLETAHRQHVVHRDVKPANILLTREGTTKVSDFGIARIMSLRDQPKLTGTGAGMGTWAFMAPEQKRDAGTVDHRADIYAVGATLFALVTNQEPHDIDRADTWREQLEAIPESLRDVITRATRYQADDRYNSAAELREALDKAISLLPPDPPGAETLLAMGARTAPDPVSPVTLVPPIAPSPPPVGGDSTYRPSSSEVWPPPVTNEYASGGRAGWAIVVLLAIGVTGLGWWLTREPAAPVIATQVVTPPPVASGTVVPAPKQPEEVIPPPAGPEVPGGDDPQPGTGGKDTGAAVKHKKPPGPKPPPPETAAVTGTEEPPVMGLIRVSLIADVNCDMLIDGVPRLRGMTRDIYATVKNNGAGSQAQSVPVGEHQIGCKGGPTETVTVSAGSAPGLVTITRKAAP